MIEIEISPLVSLSTAVSDISNRATTSPTGIVVGREIRIHQIAGHICTVLRSADSSIDGSLDFVAESLQLLIGHNACIQVVLQIHIVVSQRLTGQLVVILVGSNLLSLLTEVLILLPKFDIQHQGVVSGSDIGQSNVHLIGISGGFLTGQRLVIRSRILLSIDCFFRYAQL